MAFLSRSVWLAFGLHSVIVFTAAMVLSPLIPAQTPTGFVNPSLSVPMPIDQFLRWDAHWYTYVAQYGYTRQSIVFFPAIVLLLKIMSSFGFSTATAGFISCNIFTWFSFYFLYLLLRLDYSEQQTCRALLAYSVMPTSLFLNSIYTEPLFLTFSLACLYDVRLEKWWRAGIWAALATLTRNIGIFLLFMMLYEYWQSNRVPYQLTPSALPLLLAPTALFAWMGYNYRLTGDILAFAHSQQLWGRYFASPWSNIWNNIVRLPSSDTLVHAGMALDLYMVSGCLLVLLGLTLIPRWRPRSSYLLISWLWFVIPLCSTSLWLPLFSMSRFILVIFPLYLFAMRLPSAWFYGYLFINGIILALCTALFTNWYWIG